MVDAFKKSMEAARAANPPFQVIFTDVGAYEPPRGELSFKFQMLISARFRDEKLVSWDVESFKMFES
jgi:hypothetical protein